MLSLKSKPFCVTDVVLCISGLIAISSMVTDAEHVSWSGEGFVPSFRLRSPGSDTVLRILLITTCFKCNLDSPLEDYGFFMLLSCAITCR